MVQFEEFGEKDMPLAAVKIERGQKKDAPLITQFPRVIDNRLWSVAQFE